jgi:hypothetical protein
MNNTTLQERQKQIAHYRMPSQVARNYTESDFANCLVVYGEDRALKCILLAFDKNDEIWSFSWVSYYEDESETIIPRKWSEHWRRCHDGDEEVIINEYQLSEKEREELKENMKRIRWTLQ